MIGAGASVKANVRSVQCVEHCFARRSCRLVVLVEGFDSPDDPVSHVENPQEDIVVGLWAWLKEIICTV